ncbi:MAG: radical SAM protein [Thermoprotei archaeon]|nr:MAG: radical SAM protein [Thermoprotei archaeon]
MARRFLHIKEPIPLIGHIAFGIVDRGTNLLQIRPSSFCPFSCIFCSVDAGPNSKNRQTEFYVEMSHLLRWIRWAVSAKGLEKIHAYIDAVGDPLMYPHLVELIKRLRSQGFVETIAMETHGGLLNKKIVDALDDAGLDRINLSLDALDPQKAKILSGMPWFDVNKVVEIAEYISSSLKMDLLIAPVWVPGYNDEEIPKIIEFALRIGAGKRWPPLGIQKYEEHKYGRKPPGTKPMSWREFYEKLREWEKVYGVKLILSPEDFDIVKAERIPYAFREGERVGVRIVYWGWLKNQWLGVARNRIVTVVGVSGPPPIGMKIPVRILRVKDNIFIGKSLV